MLTETGEHARLRQVRASPESHGQVAWQRWRRGVGGDVVWGVAGTGPGTVNHVFRTRLGLPLVGPAGPTGFGAETALGWLPLGRAGVAEAWLGWPPSVDIRDAAWAVRWRGSASVLSYGPASLRRVPLETRRTEKTPLCVLPLPETPVKRALWAEVKALGPG